MEKPIDQETMALVKIVGIFIDSQEMGHTVPCRPAWKDIEVSWEAAGVGRKHIQEPLLWLLRKGTVIGEVR